jgi:hypothetical protein
LLFQLAAGDEILLVSRKTKNLPDNFSKVIGFDVKESWIP